LSAFKQTLVISQRTYQTLLLATSSSGERLTLRMHGKAKLPYDPVISKEALLENV
jgi:hypothetical protein